MHSIKYNFFKKLRPFRAYINSTLQYLQQFKFTSKENQLFGVTYEKLKHKKLLFKQCIP